MTDLAIEYNDRKPDFTMSKGSVDLWFIDESNLVMCWRQEDSEEWMKLYKDFDCWWVSRIRDHNKKKQDSILEPGQMNHLEEALASYLIEREFL